MASSRLHSAPSATLFQLRTTHLETGKMPLEKLPKSILESVVLPFLGIQDAAKLHTVSSLLYGKLYEVIEKTILKHLLTFVVRGQQAEIEMIIKSVPALLAKYYQNTIITPCGLQVSGVTPYECAIREGDVEMVAMMAGYFSEFKGGEDERTLQNKRYLPIIEKMLDQKPYDFSKLVKIIQESSIEDIRAELNYDKDQEHKSDLRAALEKFRNDFKPGWITGKDIRLHCNYQHLIHAFNTRRQEYDNFKNDEQIGLFEQQIIGYVQLVTLPAYDRQAFARSLTHIRKGVVMEPQERSFKFDKYEHDDTSFPDFDNSHSGLGFDYYVIENGRAGIDSAGKWWQTGGTLTGCEILRQIEQKRMALLSNLYNSLEASTKSNGTHPGPSEIARIALSP